MVMSRSRLQMHDRDHSPTSWREHQPNAWDLCSGHPAPHGPRTRAHVPVKEVIPANHPEEARGVSHRVELVVHLFKLLVHDVSGFTLCLAAGAGPVGKMQRKPIREEELCYASLLRGSGPRPRPTNPGSQCLPEARSPASPSASLWPSSLFCPVPLKMRSVWRFPAVVPTGLGTLQEGAVPESVLHSLRLAWAWHTVGAQQLFAEGTASLAVSVVGWLGTLPRGQLR